MSLEPSGVPSRAAIEASADAPGTLAAGWAGSLGCHSRRGVVELVLAVAKSTWAADEIIATAPSGFRPTSGDRFDAVASTGTGGAVMVKISAAGTITAVLAGTTGLAGSITFTQ
jgi:hypothetical protein